MIISFELDLPALEASSVCRAYWSLSDENNYNIKSLKELLVNFMMENILIATDGSKHSESASDVGIDMAKLFGAKVTALYVIDTSKEYASLGALETKESGSLIAGIKSNLQSQGEAATDRIIEKAKAAGLTANSIIMEGHPAEDILKFAREGKMDLIVVGGIGVSGLEKFLLGSVAEKVVRNSKVPVLVVRAD